MKYFVISLLTIFIVLGIIVLLNKLIRYKVPSIKYRQSTIYLMVKEIIPKELYNKSSKEKQSDKHRNKTSFKVMFVEDKAYWVLNNVFYTADAINGMVVEETIQEVDTLTMPKEELEKMLFILDNLKDGDQNDSGSSGNGGV